MTDADLTSQDLARYLVSRNPRLRTAGLTRDVLYQQAREQALNEIYGQGIEVDPESNLLTLFNMLGIVEAPQAPGAGQGAGPLEEKKEEPALPTEELTVVAPISPDIAALYQSVISDTVERLAEEPEEPLDEEYLDALITGNKRALPASIEAKRELAHQLLESYFTTRGIAVPHDYPLEALTQIASAIGEEEQAQGVDTGPIFTTAALYWSNQATKSQGPQGPQGREEKKQGKQRISRTALLRALEVLGQPTEEVDELPREELNNYVRDNYLSALQRLGVQNPPARDAPLNDLVQAYEDASGITVEKKQLAELKEDVQRLLNSQIVNNSKQGILNATRKLLQQPPKNLPQGEDRKELVQNITSLLELPYDAPRYDASDNYVDLVGMFLVTKYPDVYGAIGDYRVLQRKKLLDPRILGGGLSDQELDRLRQFVVGVNTEAAELAQAGYTNLTASFQALRKSQPVKPKNSTTASKPKPRLLKLSGKNTGVSMSSRSLPKAKK